MVAYSFKKRFVAPIQAGLGILPGIPVVHQGGSFGPECIDVIEYVPNPDPPFPKRQTIRAVGKKRHARVGEVVQLYSAMRTKECQSIGVGRCTWSGPISIKFINGGGGQIEIGSDGGMEILDRIIRTPAGLDEFARSDGFENWKDMRGFWEQEHGLKPFSGVLIQWEPIT